MKTRLLPILITVWLVLLSMSGVAAQTPTAPKNVGVAAIGTAFTYQGYLVNNGVPAQGTFDFEFKLYNAASGGTQIGSTIQRPDVAVSGGTFSVDLDFGGAAFPGVPRFLAIGVRPGASTGAFTTLSPRQALTAVPYALYAQNIPLAGSGSAATAARSDHNHFAANWTGTAFDGLTVNNTSTQPGASGIFGHITPTNPGGSSAGVWGINEGTAAAGIGVAGIQNGSGWGVFGRTNAGLGVYGYTSGGNSSSTPTTGVQGESAGVNGTGVLGIAENGTSAWGVGGYSTNGIGVLGITTNGYAGFFNGRVHVEGTFTSSDKQFKIDHPLDPANKYLHHASIESSDMKNMYDGVVTLGADGSAVVTLPDWFEALNQDFRYQLTAIGAPGPNLYIAQEIKDNRFAIAGGKPGMKVSWQVTGIRHDPYAEQHRMQVEVDKSAEERGTYLYPQGYGKPASAEANYQKQQQMKQLQPAAPANSPLLQR